jgi:hypothetical protein
MYIGLSLLNDKITHSHFVIIIVQLVLLLFLGIFFLINHKAYLYSLVGFPDHIVILRFIIKERSKLLLKQ